MGGFLAVALKSVHRGSIFIPTFPIGKLSMKLHSTPEQIHQFTIAKCVNPAPFAITAPSSPHSPLLPEQLQPPPCTACPLWDTPLSQFNPLIQQKTIHFFHPVSKFAAVTLNPHFYPSKANLLRRTAIILSQHYVKLSASKALSLILPPLTQIKRNHTST